MKKCAKTASTLILSLVMTVLSTVHAKSVVLYQNATIDVAETFPDATDLWIKPADLTRVNGFELKPEGACIDDICVPVRQSENSNIFVTRNGQAWFNVTELAARLQQPVVADYDSGVFSFGAIPAQRASFFNKAIAPNFKLRDVAGSEVELSDFKGKKIMLLTWASW